MKFNIGDTVRIKQTSKSKYKGYFGVVIGYCQGRCPNICRIQLWDKKIIQIYDYNLEKTEIKE